MRFRAGLWSMFAAEPTFALRLVSFGYNRGVPSDTDLQYAVAAALVARALASRGSADFKTVLGHILDYAARLPLREMGVMLVSDIHRHVGQPLFAVPQFAGWARQVADIVLYD